MIDHHLPKVASWLKLMVKLDGDDDEYTIFYCNPLECIKALYGNPAFTDKMAFAPEKQWSDEEKTSRLYNEMHTGNWWWETQDKVNTPGATIIPVIVSTDKSQLTTFSGGKEAYPAYITIGNIPKSIRRKPSLNPQLIFAYLPTEQFALKNLSKQDQRCAKARLFHAAFKEIFKSLEVAGREGVKCSSGDGKCPCLPKSLGVYAHTDDLRTQSQTLRVLRVASKAGNQKQEESILQQQGVTGVLEPFWKNLPHTDIHQSITPDILHQLYQGMIKHLTRWINRIIGPKELDQHLQRMPPNHSRRVYPKGINGFSRLSGNEHRQLSKQLLGCLIDYAEPAVINAALALLDFLYMAQYQSHSDDTLVYVKDALYRFHLYKKVFIKLGARDGNNFNLPKLHSLLHYVGAIKLFGTMDNYNSETTERLHINFVKEAYCASNCRDHIPQMVIWMERQEKIESFAQLVKWREEELKEESERASQEPESDNNRRRKMPTPVQVSDGISRRIQLAKLPSDPFVPVIKLIQDYGATHFTCSLEAYLRQQHNSLRGGAHAAYIPTRVPHTLPATSVPVWHRIKLAHENVQGMECIQDTQDAIHVYLARSKQDYGGSQTLHERFDTVLVNEQGQAEVTGAKGLRVAQVRVVFKVPHEICMAYLGPHEAHWPGYLVYMEWFSRLKQSPERDHRMFRVTQEQEDRERPEGAAVIDITSIVRSCHLIPQFFYDSPVSKSPAKNWTSQNVLEECTSFFLNNFLNQQSYQVIW
ncbi:hypothetical protein FRC02_001369 [Tulasnella sp. 418]|nr:hypothetical protein FRC02_001369 [Tulasnella sp. 418]